MTDIIYPTLADIILEMEQRGYTVTYDWTIDVSAVRGVLQIERDEHIYCYVGAGNDAKCIAVARPRHEHRGSQR